MKKNRLIFVLGLFLTVSVLLFACGTTDETSTSDNDESGAEAQDVTSDENGTDGEEDSDIRIGSTVITAQHAFYVDVIKGMEDKASEEGVELQVVDPDHDLARQTKQIQDFIQQQVDALIVYGVDPEAIVPPVEEAIEAGIPVITADMKLSTDEVSTFIGTNNKEAGKIAGDFAAEYIEENLDGEAKVGILLWESSLTQQDRAAGFIEGVEAVSGVEIVAELPGNDRETSLSSTQSMLQSNPDLDIIFATNEGGALGAMSALEMDGNEDVQLIGFDITQELAGAIKEEKVLATVAQLPVLMGEMTVESALAVLNGEELDPITDLPAELVTVDNVDEMN